MAFGGRLPRAQQLLLRVCRGPRIGCRWRHAVVAGQPPQPPMPLLCRSIEPFVLRGMCTEVKSSSWMVYKARCSCSWAQALMRAHESFSLEAAVGVTPPLLLSQRSRSCLSPLTGSKQLTCAHDWMKSECRTRNGATALGELRCYHRASNALPYSEIAASYIEPSEAW